MLRSVQEVMRALFIIFCVIALFSSSLKAEIMSAPSVEWLACSSPRVYVGKIIQFTVEPGPHQVTYQHCRLQISEVIKGGTEQEIEFVVRALGDKPNMEPFFKSQNSVLIFLKVAENMEKAIDGKWIPEMIEYGLPCVDLTSLPKELYSKEMSIIDDPDQLLKLTREWAKSPIQYSLQSEVPFGNPIHRQLFAGSLCYLQVPAEEKFREVLMKQTFSASDWERKGAATELWKFPGEQTVARLRELLEDNSEETWSYSKDLITKFEYGVRRAAAGSLRRLGEPVPDLVFEREPTAEEQRKCREEAWLQSFNRASDGKWQVEIHSGESRMLDRRERTIVHVTCTSDEGVARLVLVPKEWPREEFSDLNDLGINGANSQGARRFYVDGEIDDIKRQIIIKYFGLE